MVTPLAHEYDDALDLHFMLLPLFIDPSILGPKRFLLEVWNELASGQNALPDRKDFSVARLLENAARTGFVQLDRAKRDAVFTLYPSEMVDRGSLNDWTGSGFIDRMLPGYGTRYSAAMIDAFDARAISLITGFNPVAGREHVRHFSVGLPVGDRTGGQDMLAVSFEALPEKTSWPGFEAIDQSTKRRAAF